MPVSKTSPYQPAASTSFLSLKTSFLESSYHSVRKPKQLIQSLAEQPDFQSCEWATLEVAPQPPVDLPQISSQRRDETCQALARLQIHGQNK